MNDKEWDDLFSVLESWRAEIIAGPGGDPSVTAIAERTGQDPWAVLVSTIISLRTKDAVTLAASERLLSRAPDAASTLRTPEDEIAAMIYPAGFFRNKAASIRKIAAIVSDKYGGRVPDSAEALLELPGVGLKTANLVLSEAFGIDAICVDVHVHRISNRTGWIETDRPDESEESLRSVLPRRYWKRINALLVLYGQRICTPTSPKCSECVIGKFCVRRGVGKSR